MRIGALGFGLGILALTVAAAAPASAEFFNCNQRPGQLLYSYSGSPRQLRQPQFQLRPPLYQRLLGAVLAPALPGARDLFRFAPLWKRPPTVVVLAAMRRPMRDDSESIVCGAGRPADRHGAACCRAGFGCAEAPASAHHRASARRRTIAPDRQALLPRPAGERIPRERAGDRAAHAMLVAVGGTAGISLQVRF